MCVCHMVFSRPY